MIRSISWLTAVALLGGCMAGCENTSEAVKKDVATDTKAVTTKVEGARKEVHEIRKNAGAGLILTPQIKTAIVEDYVLRSRSNNINVDSTMTTVHLTGHVLNAKMKQRAQDDAEAVLQHRDAPQKVVNDLKVLGGK